MKSSEKKRILIVEDDRHIAEGLRLNLRLKGYDPQIALDGIAALRLWKEWKPDLIVLDIMLPHIDGLTVLRNIRLADGRLPILILSARGEPEHRVEGLSLGSDDYLTKPFNLDEFLLRVERLLSRAARQREGSGEATAGTYAFGGNVIDFDRFKATCREGEINLTEQEVKLLKLFVANRGKPLSRGEILEMGWGYTGSTPTRTVDNFVMRFRKYFEDDPHEPVYFKSLRSVGYIFDHDSEAEDPINAGR
ncbi:MAG TPA: response regulator transcription factor [Syntrophales bacterium]|nr:response regulator transcription factor [Syntrophales bacterium]